MIRPWHTWVFFAFFLAIVLAAMGFVSMTVLRLDKAEAVATRQAEREELVRLALWRMDSALGPLVKDMGEMPYFFYRSFYPADRAYTSMFAEIRAGEVLLPSPLLKLDSPHIRLHFQVDPERRFTSPQVPTGNMRDLAEAAYTTRERIEEAAARVRRVAELVDVDALIESLPERLTPSPTPSDLPDLQIVKADAALEQRWTQQAEVQQSRSLAERRARMQRQALNVAPSQQADTNDWDPSQVVLTLGAPAGDVSLGPMTPVWMGGSLLLARRVTVADSVYVQGCVLDWPGIRGMLLDGVRDLLPSAELMPLGEGAGPSDTRLLAELPVRLSPGEVAASGVGHVSAVRVPLMIAWGCVLVAAVAIAILLAGSVTLSERRAAFVSAVTHEMRTPLTTVSMYADMLIKGMVPDEQKRKHYLATLRAEAHRLSHLIENVLAYSRLERVRHASRREPINLGDLLGRVTHRLASRAEQADMQLVVEAQSPATEFGVYVDVSAVEQVLFNLVDNACKYAAGATDRRIHLQLSHAASGARLAVQDHGPGIAPGDAKRLFRPFSKSAQQAARTAPGVGLGLALSRRLARSMGGQLEVCQAAGGGAVFVLTLPIR